MMKFLKIINSKEYNRYLRDDIYKYIPPKWIYTFQKWIKPRVICKYISQQDKGVVGYGVGVFLKESDISKDEYKKRLIDTINSLKEQEEYADIKYILNENLNLEYDDLKEIEDICNIAVPSGKNIFAKFVLSCLKKICEIKEEDMSQKEVFIVSDDTKVTECLVEELAKDTKYIEVFTQEDSFGGRLENDMFNKYGLSLHATKELEKVYSNFDFVINLNEKPILDISRMSKNKIIIDLSDSKALNRSFVNRSKRIIIIDDLFLKNTREVCSEGENGKLESSLSTSTSSLINKYSENIESVYLFSRIYSMKELVDIFNINKQDKSHFNKVDNI